jgi:hypothetical protein
MKSDDKNKKWNQKFKNIFSPKILSSTWEKEGMEVSLSIVIINLKIIIFIYKDNFQKR